MKFINCIICKIIGHSWLLRSVCYPSNSFPIGYNYCGSNNFGKYEGSCTRCNEYRNDLLHKFSIDGLVEYSDDFAEPGKGE